MINAAAIVVMKAGWGQGHGRERSCELGSAAKLNQAFLRVRQATVQLVNCLQTDPQPLTPAMSTAVVNVAV